MLGWIVIVLCVVVVEAFRWWRIKAIRQQCDDNVWSVRKQIAAVAKTDIKTKDKLLAKLTEDVKTLQNMVQERDAALMDDTQLMDEMKAKLKHAQESCAKLQNEKAELLTRCRKASEYLTQPS